MKSQQVRDWTLTSMQMTVQALDTITNDLGHECGIFQTAPGLQPAKLDASIQN